MLHTAVFFLPFYAAYVIDENNNSPVKERSAEWRGEMQQFSSFQH